MAAPAGKGSRRAPEGEDEPPDCEAYASEDSDRPRKQPWRARHSGSASPSPWDDDEGSDGEQSYGAAVGQCCAWCLTNHTDIPLFFISFIILYLSINRCCYCVMVVAIISALLCMRFPLLNATLWSALIVLYLHKDWNLNFGNVRVSWNRAT